MQPPSDKRKILLIGGTGLLGRHIHQLLRERGFDSRIGSRRSGPDGETVFADLKDPQSLAAACQGVEVVVSTATAIVSTQPGDSLETVDLRGQLALVDAARSAGVKQFVYISFPPQAETFDLQTAKRKVEDHLHETLPHTILRPTYFTEVWLGPALGFDLREHRLRVYGSGDAAVPFISIEDVAAAAATAVEQSCLGTYELAGPAAIAPNQLITMLEQEHDQRFEVDRVPASTLRAQYETAQDPRQQAFFALAMGCARGVTVDPAARGPLPAPRGSVYEYARNMLQVAR
jgi:uncharacterized protein YbjT (DUF2867 family)